jgi:hypothetical protein
MNLLSGIEICAAFFVESDSRFSQPKFGFLAKFVPGIGERKRRRRLGGYDEKRENL